MKRIKGIIKESNSKRLYGLIAALPLLASALLLSCVDGQEEVATSNGGGEATVRLHISVGPIGDLNATRASDNDYLEDGELINSLCVFIVDESGNIEAKIKPNLIGTAADNGNLSGYTEQITLTTGEKTIYAFANWETAANSDWNDLINKSVGDEIGDLQILVEDPASKVNIEGGKYIPMSGMKENVTVSDMNAQNLQSVSVELERLVSKVWAYVELYDDNNEATANTVTVKGFSFSETADNVWLFKEKKGDGTITLNKDFEKTDLEISVSEGQTEEIAKFYVNETDRSENDDFEVSLNIDPYNGYTLSNSYTSSIYEIPRNSVYILTLTLDRYVFTLNATALTSILAVDGQKEYYQGAIQTTEGDYVLSLYDVTSEFILTATMTDTQADEGKQDITSSVDWKWEYENENADKESINNNDDVLETNKLTATQLTATPDYEYAYTLEAQWNDGVQHTRTYSVKVDLSKTGNPFSTQSDAPAKQSGEAATPVIMKKRETFK